MNPKLLEGLNDEQKRVVGHRAGAMICCAVAGSGKTRALTHLVAALVDEGVDPDQVCAVTFTKKAAGEMQERLRSLGCPVASGAGMPGARIGTFHSLCLQILRDGSPWARHQVDDADQMKLALKDILGYRNMDWKDADLTEVEQQIGKWKNGLVTPDEARKLPGERQMATAYTMFEDERERRGLISFDDMLYLVWRHFEQDQQAKDRWARRYEYVLVDEFQDSNTAQYELFRVLSSNAKASLVVGDDDQLIYAWRGSKPEYTLTFQEKFSAEIVRMDLNYRSRPGILEAANKVIGVNQKRIPKVNRPVRGSSGNRDVLYHLAEDMDSEASWVTDRIQEHHEDGMEWKDCTVLYRTNAQSRAFEEVLIARKIPHRVLGGVNFYERKEVADILSYLRVAVDEGNWKAFSRSVNRPFRYIGRATLDKVEQECRGRPVEFCEARAQGLRLQGRQAASLQDYCRHVRRVQGELRSAQDLPSVLSRLVEKTQYLEWLAHDEGTDTAENSRASNVRELIRTSSRFRTAQEMLAYVDQMIEAGKKRSKGEEAPDVVLLMSIHKSKGLEWPVVFVAGCAAGILPHARAEDVEEERRLFYVALTRARERAYVTCPGSAWMGTKVQPLAPSQFVAEAGLSEEMPSDQKILLKALGMEHLLPSDDEPDGVALVNDDFEDGEEGMPCSDDEEDL